MKGEFIGVWSETYREIWDQLAAQETTPSDLYVELYRELPAALKTKLSIGELADIIDNPVQAKVAFEALKAEDFLGERVLVEFMERANDALEELAGDDLAKLYRNFLSDFLEKYSLRYSLRQPCLLCPTVSGVFASLMGDLKVVTSRDVHLKALMQDYEDAVGDLRTDCSDSRIKTCFVKQINLLEAIGSVHPGVTANTVGQICDQVGTWPHESLKESLKKLYKFACDYPGVRHAGTPANAIRAIEMRDMVAMSILLAGFLPYLTDQLDVATIYRGN